MRRRRSHMPRNVVQSFKKVINHAPASIAAATRTNYNASTGTDSVAAGQTSATDTAVPTGSVIKYIEFQYSVTNLVGIASHHWISVQLTHSGQTPINPDVIGGNPNRNQVHYQLMYNVGQDQNSNHIVKFKVPKRFQRVREGDIWRLVTISDTITTQACQIIYKFYR